MYPYLRRGANQTLQTVTIQGGATRAGDDWLGQVLVLVNQCWNYTAALCPVRNLDLTNPKFPFMVLNAVAKHGRGPG